MKLEKRVVKGVKIFYKETSEGVYIEGDSLDNYFFLTVPKRHFEKTLENIVRKKRRTT